MSEGKVSIAGLDKALVLAALYNNSKPLGMGYLHFTPEPMTKEEAAVLLDDSTSKYFDYLKGRVMKVKIAGDELEPWLYDRDNGQGAAAAAIDSIRQKTEA